MSKEIYGSFLVVVAAICFGSYGLWSKLIGADMEPFFQGWTRAFIIVVILFPILFFRRLIVPIQRPDRKWFFIFLLFTSFTQAPLFYAFTHMDIGSATLLFYVAMLLTMYLVGFIFLSEKITPVKLVSFFIACFGLIQVFSFSWMYFSILTASMAILSGFASGGEVSFSKKITGKYSAIYISWLCWIAILITNLPISIIKGEHMMAPSVDIVWFWQLCYTVASLLGFWLIIKGLQYVEAGTGSLLGMLEVIFGVALGVVVFRESISISVMIGLLLILLAAALPHIQFFARARNY